MNILRCPQPPPSRGGSETQNDRFSCKIVLRCYNVSLCEYCQRQSCKVFTGLSICAEMVRRGRLLLRENLAETDQPLQKRRFLINISS